MAGAQARFELSLLRVESVLHVGVPVTLQHEAGPRRMHHGARVQQHAQRSVPEDQVEPVRPLRAGPLPAEVRDHRLRRADSSTAWSTRCAPRSQS